MSKLKRGLKNFSYLTAGKIISQAIGFIGLIYIARILGPDYYGVYVTVGVFMGMFQLVTFSGLHKVIIRKGSRDLENMGEVLDGTVGLKGLFTLIAILVMLIASFFTTYETATKLYIGIFSLKLFSKSFTSFFDTIYQATEKMQYIPLFAILYRIVYVSSAIFLLSLGYGLFSLVMVSVLTSGLEVGLKFLHSKTLIAFDIRSKVTIDKKIIWPAVIFSAIGVVNMISTRVDLLMISFLGTSEEVGIYGIAYQLVREGTMLRNLLSTAFFPIFIKAFQEKSLNRLLLVKYSLLGIGAMVVAGIFAFFYAEPIVVLLFGEDFRESGYILSVLVFYLVAWWSTLPFTTAAQATNNEKVILVGWTVMALLNVPLNLILYLSFGLIGIAYSTLIIFSIGSVIINLYSYHLLKIQGHIK